MDTSRLARRLARLRVPTPALTELLDNRIACTERGHLWWVAKCHDPFRVYGVPAPGVENRVRESRPSGRVEEHQPG
jgi:hypothetical protein